MFGVSKKKPSRKDAKVMERVAKRHRCDFIEVTLPGTGYQRWFAGPNYGSPFDQAMAKAVRTELEELGVED